MRVVAPHTLEDGTLWKLLLNHLKGKQLGKLLGRSFLPKGTAFDVLVAK